MASREPVDAPEGTAARPMVPDSRRTSHSTVGLPRLSRISRPTMSTMALMEWLSSSGNEGSGEVVLEQPLRLDDAVERDELLEQRPHVLERHGVGSVR